MDNLFFLEAKCVNCGRTFFPRYDLAADDYWTLTYGVKELPMGQRVVEEGTIKFNISKRRTGPQYKCPWCGNTDFVRCGKCKKITCVKSGAVEFSCAHCGNVGKIGGVIKGDDLKEMIKSSGIGQ